MKIFYLPDLGEGLTEAEVREWYVKEGDEVKVDQPLVSMETAKAIVDVPSPYAGKIIKLHGNPNDIIKTGAALISYETDEVEVPKPKGSVVGALEESSHKWQEETLIIPSRRERSHTIKALPAARVLAKEFNLDLSTIEPTGPDGLITVADVKNQLGQSTKSTFEGEKEILHGVRRAMAMAMSQSHREIVPVTIFDDADITETQDRDITVSLLRAMTMAAKAEPSLNAWFDGKTLGRKLLNEINIGMAVDTQEGLFVPVIKNVAGQTDAQLRQKINEYKETVRQRTISSKDMQGASITLSNFGMIAGKYATPIIVPPTVAILGCGRSREVVSARDGQVTVSKIIPLSLTFDHRAVTGGEATRFLGVLIHYLETNVQANTLVAKS